MRSILYTCVMAFGLLSFASSNVTAAPADFIDNGNYTTDTISGLDWLNVSQTFNMTTDQVTAQTGSGGSFEGWRIATEVEFLGLITNWGNAPAPTTLGVAHALPSSTISFNDLIADSSEVQVWGMFTDSTLTSHDIVHASLFEEFSTAYDFQFAIWDQEMLGAQQNLLGTFLVRGTELSVVPLPAAAWLFGAALGGLGWLTRKKKVA